MYLEVRTTLAAARSNGTDWKYILHLPLGWLRRVGFDFSIMSQFRDWLIEDELFAEANHLNQSGPEKIRRKPGRTVRSSCAVYLVLPRGGDKKIMDLEDQLL